MTAGARPGGSCSPARSNSAGISQSLAGRAAVTSLLPLSLAELIDAGMTPSTLDGYLLGGSYPPIHAHGIAPEDWLAAYVATYLERDVRQVINVKDLGAFQRFLRLCAGRTGQLLNLSSLAGETGIAQTTARAWLGVLESSGIAYLLPPYYRNFGKRLVKTPKLYFVDTGLACWLLSLRSTPNIAVSPFRGALFETLIVSEFIKMRLNAGLPADLYFWRDNNDREADLMFETEAGLQTVEIKAGATPTADYVRAGQRSSRMLEGETRTPWLIYGGDESFARSGIEVIAWRDLPRVMQERR